jgi:peptidoglycan/LPS O-acetylase OafA/YrhL
MRTCGLIVASLLLSVLLHLVGGVLGALVSYFSFGKDPIMPVFLFGYFYLPFFACGMTLAATRGFQYPWVIAPCGALVVVGLVVAAVSDQIGPYETSLLLASVPISSLGCLATYCRARRNAGTRTTPRGQQEEAASIQTARQGEQSLAAESR